MAAKGTIAKAKTVEVLAKAFGQDWIGEYNKKYYIWANDGGERIQIALTMTCPNTPVSVINAPTTGGKLDFEAEPMVTQAAAYHEPAELTDEERNRVLELMSKLGL